MRHLWEAGRGARKKERKKRNRKEKGKKASTKHYNKQKTTGQ